MPEPECTPCEEVMRKAGLSVDNKISKETLTKLRTIKFSVCMAVYDDTDNAITTIQSIRASSGIQPDRIEFVVVNNNPSNNTRNCRDRLKTLVERVGGKYIDYDLSKGTSLPKQVAVKAATNEVVVLVDSHVYLGLGSLQGVAHHAATNPEDNGLWHAIMMADSMRPEEDYSQMSPKWGGDTMFGTWAHDKRSENRAGKAYEIQMSGMGAVAFRNGSWIDMPEDLQGFGGDEGFLHEMWRNAGRKILALPRFRYWHMTRDNGDPAPYNPQFHERLTNYLIYADHIGLDPNEHVLIPWTLVASSSTMFGQGYVHVRDSGVRRFLQVRSNWVLDDHEGRYALKKQDMKPVSMATKAANYLKAMAVHLGTGAKKVSEDEFIRRTDICRMCPMRVGEECGLCGCPIDAKAALESSQCPDSPSRWLKPEPRPEPTGKTTEIFTIGKKNSEEVYTREDGNVEFFLRTSGEAINSLVVSKAGNDMLRLDLSPSNGCKHESVKCGVDVRNGRIARLTAICSNTQCRTLLLNCEVS